MFRRVRPANIIRKYYADNPEAWEILLFHCRQVARRAGKIARNLQQTRDVDLQFVVEAAMLHDIGMIMTDTPALDCHGEGSYLCHGIQGKKILELEGLPRHARVCERHIGIGLTAAEIRRQKLPLPARDMLPETLEEQIICYADLFYSKDPKKRDRVKSPEKVRKTLAKYGEGKIATFDRWLNDFEPGLN